MIRWLGLIILFLSACASCYSSRPAYLPPLPSQIERRKDLIPAPDYAGIDDLNPGQGKEWRRTMAEAFEIVQSDEFKRVVQSYDCGTPATCLVAKSRGPAMTGTEVLAKYHGESAVIGPTLTQYLITYDDPKCERQTASTGFARAGGVLFAQTTLNACTMERARSADVAARACAINTAVHELAHAVVDGNIGLYEDANHGRNEALVSYTLGSIAQCTYLVRSCKIPASRIADCVAAIGTDVFDPKSCESNWPQRFGPVNCPVSR